MLDTLLGLPLISAALLPVYSNYSTSLNLLFFYLTWSTLVLSHPPLRVEAFGLLAVRLLFYLLPSTLFLLFDAAVPSLAVAIKAQGQIALPGRSGSRGFRGPKGILRVVGWSTFNVVLGIALQVGIDLLATKVLRVKSALKIVTRLPLPWGLAKDIAKGFLVRGVSISLHSRIKASANSEAFCRASHMLVHLEWCCYTLQETISIPKPFLTVSLRDIILTLSTDPAILHSSACSPWEGLYRTLASQLAIKQQPRPVFIRCQLRSPNRLAVAPLVAIVSPSRCLPLPYSDISVVVCPNFAGRGSCVLWVFCPPLNNHTERNGSTRRGPSLDRGTRELRAMGSIGLGARNNDRRRCRGGYAGRAREAQRAGEGE